MTLRLKLTIDVWPNLNKINVTWFDFKSNPLHVYQSACLFQKLTNRDMLIIKLLKTYQDKYKHFFLLLKSKCLPFNEHIKNALQLIVWYDKTNKMSWTDYFNKNSMLCLLLYWWSTFISQISTNNRICKKLHNLISSRRVSWWKRRVNKKKALY